MFNYGNLIKCRFGGLFSKENLMEKFFSIFDKVFKGMVLAQDKANHAFYGLLLYSVINIFDPSTAVITVIALGLGKELYDELKYQGSDILDFLSTVSAPVFVYGLTKFYV